MTIEEILENRLIRFPIYRRLFAGNLHIDLFEGLNGEGKGFNSLSLGGLKRKKK